MERRRAAMRKSPVLQENVPLSGLTTLEVGGPARFFGRAGSLDDLRVLFEQARREGLEATMLGEGSNLLASDEGYEGLLVQLEDRTWQVLGDEGDTVRLLAGAGLGWDALVERAVAEGLAGVECLSGIPGLVGAAPIQNIGAYGQEVAETLVAVRALDRATGGAVRLPREECGFGYRMSRFKADWKGRFVVTGIELDLRRGEPAPVRYGDLVRLFGAGCRPTLAQVREAVLQVRRAKSMVRDPADPNRRSAGSFFVNPVVAEERAVRIRAEAPPDRPPLPAFPAGDGRVKLSAAWLIEAAGFRKGHVQGRAGLSGNHVLAIINRGGATAADLVGLAATVRRAVRERFGVTLEPEPNFLGFREPVEVLLDRG